MVLLCVARFAVALVPFRLWRGSLGRTDGPGQGSVGADIVAPARRLALHVERAAMRLPFATKCLPRAMALAWMLQRAGLGYGFKLAVRPATQRGTIDDLHAWIECDGSIVLGDLPGPWIVTLALRS